MDHDRCIKCDSIAPLGKELCQLCEDHEELLKLRVENVSMKSLIIDMKEYIEDLEERCYHE